MRRTHTRFRGSRLALVAALVALPLVVAACGSKSNASTTPSASVSASAGSAGATAQITADWQKFFAGTTAAQAKQALLQNGSQFASILKAQAGSAIAKATTAKVSSVKVTSPTTATVTYSIVQGGQVVLPNQRGQAVLEGGVWKVSASSFQSLLKLEQGAASAAPSASP